jgi:membrane associated rhomboid family serine protease
VAGQLDVEYYLAASIAAAVLGCVIGAALSATLDRFRRFLVLALTPVGIAVGAVWGAATRWIATLGFHGHMLEEDMTLLSVAAAAVVGGLLVGALLFPYVVRRARGGSTWPLVAAACACSSVLGVVALKLIVAVA